MLRNTTFNLPDELVARAKSYAAAHGTTMTALVREHLEAITSDGSNPIADDPLLAFSQGQLARNEAIRLLGLRDYAELLVALGDADLPMPLPPPHEVENQAVTFAKLWRQT
jgi:plasmid stability protein